MLKLAKSFLKHFHKTFESMHFEKTDKCTFAFSFCVFFSIFRLTYRKGLKMNQIVAAIVLFAAIDAQASFTRNSRLPLEIW